VSLEYFFRNSAYDTSISACYLKVTHCAPLLSKPAITGDDQHDSWNWIDLDKIAHDKFFHQYLRNYADNLIKKRLQDVSS
jgi:hypothetical protein